MYPSSESTLPKGKDMVDAVDERRRRHHHHCSSMPPPPADNNNNNNNNKNGISVVACAAAAAARPVVVDASLLSSSSSALPAPAPDEDDYDNAMEQFMDDLERELRETESQMELCEAFIQEEEARVSGTPTAGVYWTLWVPGHGYVTDEEYVRITGDTRYVDNPLPTGLPPMDDVSNTPCHPSAKNNQHNNKANKESPPAAQAQQNNKNNEGLPQNN